MAALLCPAKYGTLPSGEAIELWTLKGRGGLVVEAITLGGIVTRMLAPARDGKLANVVLGFDDLESYLAGNSYFGAITGRVAGRIANATFELEDYTYPLVKNNPPNHLHGGVTGFNKRVWSATSVDRTDGAPSVRLEYTSPEGEEGYPGNVRVAVIYTVTGDNVFRIETEATSDRTTPLSLTHHSYFNLAGDEVESIADHLLTVYADRMVPADENLTPSERLEQVDEANDFRKPRRLGDAIPALHRQHGALYRLPEHSEDELVTAARVEEPTNGRVLTVATTERYLQLYSGEHLHREMRGKSGEPFAQFAGVCLECEGYPDASNKAMRKEILLQPGQTQRRVTAYAFTTEGQTDAKAR
jgi:aldose 1-epimerase